MDDLRSHLCSIDALPKPRRMDAEDAALQLAQDHRDQLAYDADLECFRAYRGHAWQPIADTDLVLHRWIVEAETACDLQRSNNMKANVLTHAQAHLARTFTAQADRLAFANGTLDVATGDLRAHDPADCLTFCLSYDWHPEQPTPTIDQALAQTIPDPLARAAFITHAGLAMLSDTSLHRAGLLLGQPNTGKSTLLGLFNQLLGQPTKTFIDKSVFLSDHEGRLQRAASRTLRGMVLDEFPSDMERNEDNFKIMTSHGGIVSREHQKAPVTAQWLPKIVLSSNTQPSFKDASGALARRLLVVKCPHPPCPACQAHERLPDQC